VHHNANADESILRISLDAKATVLIGPFSRGGKSRLHICAADHDFRPDETLTPFGLYLPQENEVYLFFTSSKITSDFIVDCLQTFWQHNQWRFPHIKTLLINQDNGPENHSRRTQFMNRITKFADEFQIAIDLAYYPPYHSKYNPIERVWGALELHWNGTLLDSIDTVLNFAHSMTWKKRHPVVQWLTKTYETGVRLTQKAMAQLEQRLDRLPHLPKWFVHISPLPNT
jgi:transposase